MSGPMREGIEPWFHASFLTGERFERSRGHSRAAHANRPTPPLATAGKSRRRPRFRRAAAMVRRFISRILCPASGVTAIYLAPPLPTGSSSLPAAWRAGPAHCRCLALHAVGFAMPGLSPGRRCALTAPFHPCLWPKPIGGVFSVALSLVPIARDRWALPTTVSCRVRTLPPVPDKREPAAVLPAHRGILRPNCNHPPPTAGSRGKSHPPLPDYKRRLWLSLWSPPPRIIRF